MHSARAFKKENVATLSRKKSSSMRRPAVHIRLSDRWPVLSKIIRSAKSTASSEDCPTPTDDSGDTDDGGQTVPIRSGDDCAATTSPKCMQSTIHSTSPRFPSLLSGVRPVKRLLLARHNYPHRGYSQSALHLQREFWYRRKCEWDEYEYALHQAGLTVEEAYGGIVEDANGCSHSLPPHLRDGPWNRRFSLHSWQSSDVTSCVPTFLNLAIFPRIGDLSSARDPFLISVDTWFADFPLWTLSKMVWMYDINYRATHSTRRCQHERNNVAFIEDFDMTNSSAETLSDASDVTLVDTVSNTLPRLNVPMESLIRSRNFRKIGQPSLATLDYRNPIEKQSGPWERCWLYRWEVLYNQIGFAIDIAKFSRASSFSAAGINEVARVILTSSDILYNPLLDSVGGQMNRDYPFEEASSEDHYVAPLEVEEDDYGNVIPPSESVYRFGAQINPFSMFATTTTDYDASMILDWGSGDSDVTASHVSDDYASELVDDLRRLTIRS